MLFLPQWWSHTPHTYRKMLVPPIEHTTQYKQICIILVQSASSHARQIGYHDRVVCKLFPLLLSLQGDGVLLASLITTTSEALVTATTQTRTAILRLEFPQGNWSFHREISVCSLIVYFRPSNREKIPSPIDLIVLSTKLTLRNHSFEIIWSFKKHCFSVETDYQSLCDLTIITNLWWSFSLNFQ